MVTVRASEPGRIFAFHTGSPDEPNVHWIYEMEPTGDGTRLTESWDVELLPPSLEARAVSGE